MGIDSSHIQRFVVTQKNEEDAKVKKRVIVSINSGVEEAEVKKIVGAILNNEENNPQLLALTITNVSDQNLTYSYIDTSGEKQERTIPKGTELTSQISLNILKQPSNTRVRESWSDCLARIKTKWRAEHPKKSVTSFLWTHLILPIAAIKQRKNAQFDKYQEAVGKGGGAYAMMDTLDQTVSFLSERDDAFLHEARGVKEAGQKITKTLEKGKPIQEIAKSFAKTILDDFESKPVGSVLTIPTGYYDRAGTYHYLLLSFSKEENGNLILKKYTTDPHAKENTAGVDLFYRLDGITQAQLTHMLEGFIACQGLAISQSSTKTEKKEDAVKHYLSILGISSENLGEEAFLSDHLDRLIVGGGGVLLTGETRGIGGPKQNPWNLISHWMKMESPSEDKDAQSDKVLWLMHMAHHHLDVMLQSIDKLDTKQKQLILPELKRELDAIKRAINKEFGEEQAFEILAEQDQFFKDLSEKMEAIEVHLKSTTQKATEKATSEIQKTFAKPATNNVKVELAPQKTEDITSTKTVKAETVSVIHRLEADFNSFSESVDAHDYQTAKEQFSTFVKEVDRLIEVGDFDQAMALSTHILNLLPIPKAGNEDPNFWNTLALELDPQNPQIDQQLKLLDEWGKEVATAAKGLWETQIRLNQTHTWPDQRDAFINSRCVLFKIAQSKTYLLQQKMKAHLENLPPDEQHQLLEQIQPGYSTPEEHSPRGVMGSIINNIGEKDPGAVIEFCQEFGIEIDEDTFKSMSSRQDLIGELQAKADPDHAIVSSCKGFQTKQSFVEKQLAMPAWSNQDWNDYIEANFRDKFPRDDFLLYEIPDKTTDIPTIDQFLDKVKDPRTDLEAFFSEYQGEQLKTAKLIAFYFIRQSYRYVPPISKWQAEDFETYLGPIKEKSEEEGSLEATYWKEICDVVRTEETVDQDLSVDDIRDGLETARENAQKILEKGNKMVKEFYEGPFKKEEAVEKTINLQNLKSQPHYQAAGYFCKQCGLTEEQAKELVFLHFGIDHEQIEKHFANDPYLLSLDPQANYRQLQYQSFLQSSLPALPKPIKMDRWNESGSRDADCLKALAKIQQGYHATTISQGDEAKEPSAEVLKGLFKSMDARGLPTSMQNLRQNQIYLQCALQQNCFYLGFPATIPGMKSAVAWFQDKIDLTKEETDEQKAKEKIQTLQHADVLQRLNQMKGRLELEMGEYIVGNDPVFRIVPADKKGHPASVQEGVVYRPQGHGLDAELGVPNLQYPENARYALGQVLHEDTLQMLDVKYKGDRFQCNSEAGHLMEIFETTSAQNPFERYALATVNRPMLSQESSTLFVRSSVVEAFDYIMQYPQNLEDEKVQRMLLMSMFSHEQMQSFIVRNPQFFKERSADFQKLIEQALEKGNVKTAAFLMHVGESVQAHAAYAAEMLQEEDKGAAFLSLVLHASSKMMEKVIGKYTPDIFVEVQNAFPGFQTDYTYKKQNQEQTKQGDVILLDLLRQPKYRQKHLNTYFLDCFMRIYSPQDLKDMDDSVLLGSVLNAYFQLKNDGADSGIPLMQQKILEKMAFEYIPEILSQEMAQLEPILDHITDSVSVQGEWVKEEGSSGRFSNGSVMVDVQAGLIKSEDNQISSGTLSPLPPEVISHSLYYQIFKEETHLARVSPGRTSQEFIYALTIQKEDGEKIPVQIVYNRELKEMHITSNGLPFALNSNQLLYTPILGGNHQNAQKLLKRYGAWMNAKQSSGISIWNSPSKATEEDFFTLHADPKKKGEWILLKEPDAFTKGQSFIVCQDTEGVFSRHLHFVDPTNLLFLRSSDSPSINQFRILDKGLVFDKQEDGSWVCQKGTYEGYKWDPNGLSENSQRFVKSLGSAASECMLPLTKEGKEDVLLIWPHQIGQVSMSATGKREVSFVKRDDMQIEKAKPLLPIKIGQDGVAQSSCAGYLYLSMLYQAKGDSKRGFYYLEKAKQTRFANIKEQEVFNEIVKMIRLGPQKTAREATYKLKAELAIAKIQREQIGLPFYKTEDPQSYMVHTTAITKLYNTYQEKVDASTQKRPQAVIEEELWLTDDEEEEYKKMRLESLQFLTTEPPQSQAAAPGAIQYKIPATVQEAPGFFKDVLINMAKPSQKPNQILEDIQILDKTRFLPFFFHYAEKIQKDRLTPDDLKNLMTAPIKAEGADAQSIEFARRTLLSLAQLNQLNKQENPPAENPIAEDTPLFSVKSFYQMKKSLPSSISNRKKMLGGYIDAKKILNTQSVYENFEAPFNRLFNFLRETQNSTIKLESLPQQVLTQAEELRKETTVQIAQLKEFLKDESCPLTSQEKTLLEKSLDEIEKSADQNTLAAYHTVTQLVTLLANYGVNLVETRRHAVMASRIEEREEEIGKESVSLDLSGAGPSKLPALQLIFANPVMDAKELQVPKEMFDQLEGLFDPKSVDIDELTTSALSYFEDHPDATEMEKAENAKHQKGITSAAEKLQAELNERRTLDAIDPVINEIKRVSNNLQVAIEARKATLLTWARSSAAPASLRNMAKNSDLYGEAELLREVLNCYQKGMLRTSISEDEDEEICKTVTEFLYLSTSVQQMGKAITSLEDGKTFQEDEKIQAISKAYALLKEGVQTDRYHLADGTFDDPSLGRKKLLSDYFSAHIMTKLQSDAIELFLKEPNSSKIIPMSKGKTSKIMPIILGMFAERGMLAVGLITEELITQHWSELDETTRTMLRQAGVIFKLSPDVLMSPAFYAEKYDNLLRVREEKGYVISTIQSINAVESQLKLIANRLVELEDELAANPEEKNRIAQEMITLAMQEMWLVKIKGLFDADKETQNNALGFRTQFLADEYDAIFDVRMEINQALGSQKTVDQTVVEVGDHLMTALMHDFTAEETSLSDEDKENLMLLQDAVKLNAQAALTTFQREDGIKALAKLVVDPFYASKFGFADDFTGLTEDQMEEWIHYLIGDSKSKKDAIIPDCLPKPIPDQIIDLKRFLAIPGGSLMQGLEKNVGVDMGARKVDGCVPVPLQDKGEILNTNYGDPYEMVTNGFLLSLSYGATDEFYQRALPLVQQKDPVFYRSIMENCKGDPLAYLRKPENWSDRVKIFKECVVEEGFLRLAQKQVTANVQHVIQGKNCGGISGTDSSFSTPVGFVRNEKEASREVEGNTYLRIGLGAPLGLQTPCHVFEESKMLEQVKTRIGEDPKVNTVIVTGLSLGGKKTFEIIKELREKQPERQYIYIDSDTRKKMMWNPEEEKPVEFDAKRVNKEIALFYFDPADKRGTDFVIPPGKALFLCGPNTLEPQCNQAIWRRRNAGLETEFEPYITPAVASRIKEAEELEKDEAVEFGHLINDIKKKTVQENGPLNFKQELIRIQGMTRHHLEQLRFRQQPQKLEEDYWTPDEKHVKTALMDIFYDNMLFRFAQDLVIVDKAIVRNENASYQEDSVERLIQICQDAIDHINKGDKSIQYQLGEVKGKLKESYIALHFTPTDDKKEDRKQFNKLSVEFENLYHQQFKEINKGFNELVDDLKKLKKEYEQHPDILKEKLPSLVASDASSSGHSMEQVQEMQQVQVQQQQQIQSTGKDVTSIAKVPSRYLTFNADNWINPKDEADIERSLAAPAFENLVEGVYITPEAQKLLELVNDDPNGHPLFRLLITQSPIDKSARVCLVTKNDFQENLFVRLTSVEDEDTIAAVYSFDTSSEEELKKKYDGTDGKKAVGLHFVQTAHAMPDLTNDEDLILKVAIAKFRAGFKDYTTAEKKALKEWLKEIEGDDANAHLIEMAKVKGIYR